MREKTILLLLLALAFCLTLRAETYSSKFGPPKPTAAPAPGTNPNDPTFEAMVQSPTMKVGFARITAYWPGEDYYTNHKMTATGVRLRTGFCAVNSRIIPYGSVVMIPGIGNFLAMDTGTAVINRKAARESGHTKAERSALVIDVYFATRKAGELFMQGGPKFAMIAWDPNGPTSVGLGLASAQ